MACAASPAATAAPAPLGLGMMIASSLVLAAANFLVVLDTTIANVSAPNIAGALGASPEQGTWVITSYAVAEAVTVPLTGWLAARFGPIRIFVAGMFGFGVCSFLCGLAPVLGVLVLLRFLQGLCGGPLIPLTQTLLLRVFPKNLKTAATGIWAITTLIAPIIGPILGGVLCDDIGWSYIFWINVPVAIATAGLAWNLLRTFETAPSRARIDVVGLGLLIFWVTCLQVMLDTGKDRDWFASPFTIALAVGASVGFGFFVIWELTDRNPVVDLRVFRHRGYTAAVATVVLGYGAVFGINVLTPLWLQQNMGYTATWAGLVSAQLGVSAVAIAPLAAILAPRIDVRRLAFIGLAWMGAVTVLRAQMTSQASLFAISQGLLLQGLGLPFFFVPLTGFALACVDARETTSAAGLMSFCRTMAGALATSIITTAWDNDANRDHSELAGVLGGAQDTIDRLKALGFGAEPARAYVDRMVQQQSIMLAANALFMAAAGAFVLASLAIWLAPRPKRAMQGGGAH
ncbi:MAG: DHA2 family efflux MFS transporter permease subunit [Caulobacteraceae bacterium]|nr:DHA2 family efflux MFS transporter permease subunit [Caulobacteraceae bacterium]